MMAQPLFGFGVAMRCERSEYGKSQLFKFTVSSRQTSIFYALSSPLIDFTNCQSEQKSKCMLGFLYAVQIEAKFDEYFTKLSSCSKPKSPLKFLAKLSK